MMRSKLRAIPAVERVLLAVGKTGLPRPTVVAVTRREIAALRKQVTIPEFNVVVAGIRDALRKLDAARIQPVINGTGILVHTNFGRAPLGPSVIDAMAQIGSSYNNLEYDLSEGERGSRAAYLEYNLALLCGSEAATVVNNNAAALILILRHFCRSETGHRQHSRVSNHDKPILKNEVIISRGELIQIGGGFRIPEILEASGAELCEIGTTNKTTLNDYARAITRRTALILKVHRSNFFMDGFVGSPQTDQIVAVAHKKRIPFVEDLGSGAMIETRMLAGLEHEPTPAESLSHGVDLVCFSGDKLLGGPQAGIIAGKAKWIAALKQEPFFRALRCDKLVLAALEAVVDSYLCAREVPSTEPNSEINVQSSLCSEIPVMSMLNVSNDKLRTRAEKMITALNGLPVTVRVGTGRAQIGGGTLPRSGIASVTLDLTHPTLKPQEISARLRGWTVPIIGYIERGKVKIDLRTVFPKEDAELIRAIQSLAEVREA